MSMRFSLGTGLLRAAVSLGFLGCLIAVGNVSSQPATSESAAATGKAVVGASVAMPGFRGAKSAAPTSCSDLTLTVRMEVGLPNEFGVAFEDDDSFEMLRVDIEQRTYGIDQYVIGPGVASTTARNVPPNFSPPLLV